MIMHRLERVLGAAEHASKPGHNLLPLEPLTPRRILGTADVPDHGEIAQEHNRGRTALSVGHGRDSIAVQPKPCGKGDPSGPRVEVVEAFQG